MGWVSYVEDILDRLFDDLQSMSSIIEQPDAKQANIYEQWWLWRTKADQLLRDLRDHLEVATDPAIDVADEVLRLKRQQDKLKTKAELASNAAIQVWKERDNALHQLQAVKDELKQREKEIKKLKRDIEQQLSENLQQRPEDVYATYAPSVADLKDKYQPSSKKS